MFDQYRTPDLSFCSNNGTIAVYINPDGRLGRLAQRYETTYEGVNGQEVFWTNPMVWVFKGGFGHDAELQALIQGDLQAWEAFRASCEANGIVVRYGGCYVPLSNGSQFVKYDDQDQPIRSWAWDTQTLRTDFFPTPEELARLISAG